VYHEQINHNDFFELMILLKYKKETSLKKLFLSYYSPILNGALFAKRSGAKETEWKVRKAAK
jgi:hypothetical protein